MLQVLGFAIIDITWSSRHPQGVTLHWCGCEPTLSCDSVTHKGRRDIGIKPALATLARISSNPVSDLFPDGILAGFDARATGCTTDDL